MEESFSPGNSELKAVIAAFVPRLEGCRWQQLGNGNINDTYLVTTPRSEFVLQRINGTVFPYPEQVVENVAKVTSHIGDQGGRSGAVPPELLRAGNGGLFHRDGNGHIWRAQQYIAEGRVLDSLQCLEQARKIGGCLARFHDLVEGLPPEALQETLPGFHDLPGYLENYDHACRSGRVSGEGVMFGEDVGQCRDVVERFRPAAGFFQEALAGGDLQRKVVHGDPKVANILFHRESGEALTLIDLDTVGPGLVLQDIGDCLRSCSFRGREVVCEGRIDCDIETAAAVVEGYLNTRKLTPFEVTAIPKALLLITFELGVRFLTDYFQGNRYFKINHPQDNLNRAVVQLRLAESIAGKMEALERRISEVL